MAPYKLLFLDLDGTLLEDDLFILPGVVCALKRLQEKKVFVAIATGRAFPSAKKYADILGLASPIICYNGAVIRFADGTLFEQEPLSLETMRRVIFLCEQNNWYLQLYNDDKILTANVDENTYKDPDSQNMPLLSVGQLSKAVLKPTPKMMMRCCPKEAKHRAAKIQEEIKELYVTGSAEDLVEMMSRNVNKANAIKKICSYYGYDATKAVACGDSDNDIDMLQFVGMGCAVANASEGAKTAANYVSEKKQGEGILEIISNFF